MSPPEAEGPLGCAKLGKARFSFCFISFNRVIKCLTEHLRPTPLFRSGNVKSWDPQIFLTTIRRCRRACRVSLLLHFHFNALDSNPTCLSQRRRRKETRGKLSVVVLSLADTAEVGGQQHNQWGEKRKRKWTRKKTDASLHRVHTETEKSAENFVWSDKKKQKKTSTSSLGHVTTLCVCDELQPNKHHR